MLTVGGKRRVGITVDRLWSDLGGASGKLLLAADEFINQVRQILFAVSKESLKTKQGYPAAKMAEALREYAALMQLHSTKEALCQLERARKEHTQLEDSIVHPTFKQFFDLISAPVPEAWVSLFDGRLRLAHECWVRLSWNERAALKGGFLAQKLFRFLQVCYSVHRLSV
jgi:hypothetical protein